MATGAWAAAGEEGEGVAGLLVVLFLIGSCHSPYRAMMRDLHYPESLIHPKHAKQIPANGESQYDVMEYVIQSSI